MDRKELSLKVNQVLKDLTPSHVQILSVDDQVFTLLVVSEKFAGIPLSKRFELLAELFEEKGEEVAQRYSLVFQAWTKAEADDLDGSGISKSSQSHSVKQSRAAKPAEL